MRTPPRFETDANGRTPKPKRTQADAPQTSLHNIQPHVKTGSTVFHPVNLPESKLLKLLHHPGFESKLLKLPHCPGFESGTIHLQVNHSTTRVLTRSDNTFLRAGIVILVQKKFTQKIPTPSFCPLFRPVTTFVLTFPIMRSTIGGGVMPVHNTLAGNCFSNGSCNANMNAKRTQMDTPQN